MGRQPRNARDTGYWEGYDAAKAAADKKMADLRAKVKALPPNMFDGRFFLYENDVLALFDGSSDD